MKDSIIPVEPHLLGLINPNLQWPALLFPKKSSKSCGKFLSETAAVFEDLLGV